MNKLIINKGTFKLREVEINKSTLTIGRAGDNDIQLNDTAVSGYHAKVVTLMGVTYIKDLGSTNGTIVNGKKIDSYSLKPDDLVSIGQHLLLFQADAESQRSQTEDDASEHTQLIGMSETQRLKDMAAAVSSQKQNTSQDNDKSVSPVKLKIVKNSLINGIHAQNVALINNSSTNKAANPIPPLVDSASDLRSNENANIPANLATEEVLSKVPAETHRKAEVHSIENSQQKPKLQQPKPQQKITPLPIQEKRKRVSPGFDKTQHLSEDIVAAADENITVSSAKPRRVLKPGARTSVPTHEKKPAAAQQHNRKVIIEDVLYTGNGHSASVSSVGREQMLSQIIMREGNPRTKNAMTSLHKIVTLVGGLIILGLSLVYLL